jgi:hypothetical protein
LGDRVKRKPFISALLAAFVLVAPTLVVAEDPPMPLPRRAERMPAGTETAPAVPPVSATTPAPAETSAVEAAAQVAKPVGKPQDVTLVAKVTEDGQDIPDGLTWRVFETRTDATGELALAGKSQDAKASFKLVPGSYVVHVAYGRAQTTETITVSDTDASANSKELVLDAGAIRLNAAVTGDVPIPINLQRFDIFSGTTDADRQPVAQSLGPNDVVTLNAGTYHVVSYFGDVNAVVRADLRVEPGQMTDATLYHKAAQVSFKLVSEAGGEAIADIDWTVKTAEGEQIFTATGAFPTAVLAEGEYQVFAKRGDQVYNRGFEVQAGPAKEIEVLTSVYNQTGT